METAPRNETFQGSAYYGFVDHSEFCAVKVDGTTEKPAEASSMLAFTQMLTTSLNKENLKLTS